MGLGFPVPGMRARTPFILYAFPGRWPVYARGIPRGRVARPWPASIPILLCCLRHVERPIYIAGLVAPGANPVFSLWPTDDSRPMIPGANLPVPSLSRPIAPHPSMRPGCEMPGFGLARPRIPSRAESRSSARQCRPGATAGRPRAGKRAESRMPARCASCGRAISKGGLG